MNMKIVLAHGCFDPLHYGHIYHLQAASKLGTHLYVAVTDDKHVGKGPHRPAIPQQQRLDSVRALRCVTYGFLVEGWQEAMRLVRPHVYVKGAEYEGKLPEADYCARRGIEISYTRVKTYSSTKLLRHYADREVTIPGVN